MTMNNSWAYNRAEVDAYKPTSQLIRTLVDVVSRGGNYLLNVGPTPEGKIPAQADVRLREMGTWLETNGEAIYETRYGPLQMTETARSTARDGTLYLHVLDWPRQGKIRLPWFPGQWFEGPVAKVRLLADGRELAFSQGGGGLTIEVPRQAPDKAVSVLALRA
jgi:alpha-L-fucosidase